MARQFSGSNYLYNGFADYLMGLSAVTFSGWAYRPSAGLNVGVMGSVYNTAYLLGLYWFSDNKLYMDSRNGSTYYGNSDALSTTGWVHIAGTFDGNATEDTKYQVYINGELATTFQTTAGTQPSITTGFGIDTSSLRVGAVGNIVISGNNTRLAYVQAFNAALNRTGIRESMRHPRRIAGSTTCLNSWALDISNSIGSSSPGGGIWERDMTGRRDMDSYNTTHHTTQPPILII